LQLPHVLGYDYVASAIDIASLKSHRRAVFEIKSKHKNLNKFFVIYSMGKCKVTPMLN
jgi:hypothetical protein